eukprot:TRINITY_DN11945_c0_g1_i4.p1 TRINITY_DN11945_c0_g1~~TRINITY_DN11945_c0_g1_i4.p1  ORF type:complete len:975 (+),score=239.08 TRINITY_DN11945_c0_g1_i4:1456-4380(+)
MLSAQTCELCVGPIDSEDKQPLGGSATIACPVILRRRYPTDWEAGLPKDIQQFASHYEIYLQIEADDDVDGELYVLPSLAVDQDEDPVETCREQLPHVRAKRVRFVDTVTIPFEGKQVMVCCLPVDHGTMSIDGTGVNELAAEHTFVSLRDLILDLRNTRSRGPRYSTDLITRMALGRFTEWLSQLHVHMPNVVRLWAPHPQSRIQNSCTNLAWNGNTPATSTCRLAPRAVQNPLFGSQLVLKEPGPEREQYEDDYSVLSLKQHRANQRQASKLGNIRENASATRWSERYRLHAAAVAGDSEKARNILMDTSVSANEFDSDGWTPLHYASYHGNEAVARLLMEDWRGGPNLTTPTQSTALHLAALNGHTGVIRLLIACPLVDRQQKDGEGRTPVELCQLGHIGEWQEAIDVLTSDQNDAVNRYAKFRMFEAGGPMENFRVLLVAGHVKVLRLPAGDVITAMNLRDALCALLQLPEDCFDFFRIWINSGDYQLQLRQDSFPLRELQNVKQSSALADPHLVLKRNVFLNLQMERKVVDKAVLKLLFDQALDSYLSSEWPLDVNDAAHLAALLMQIRFGDHREGTHVAGFLSGALATFVPQHLLSIRHSEWEKLIFEKHRTFRGTTDIVSLHRLFLQYCRQWPFYGSVVYKVQFLKRKKKNKLDPWMVAINADFLTFARPMATEVKLAIGWDEVVSMLDTANRVVILELKLRDLSKLALLQPYLLGNRIMLQSVQAVTLHALIQTMIAKLVDAARAVEQKRIAQGGPRVLEHVSAQPVTMKDGQDQSTAQRQERERRRRYDIIATFGAQPTTKSYDISMAELHFREKHGHANRDYKVALKDLKYLCYGMGYWLGPELQGAEASLTNGTGYFTFRDFVSWWSQSSQSWLYLLDNEAFEQRVKATEVFQRFDSATTGKIVDDDLNGFITALQQEIVPKRTERAIRQGLDPTNKNLITFKGFLSWLLELYIIDDRRPETA